METTIVTAIATPQMLYLVCNRKDLALEKKDYKFRKVYLHLV